MPGFFGSKGYTPEGTEEQGRLLGEGARGEGWTAYKTPTTYEQSSMGPIKRGGETAYKRKAAPKMPTFTYRPGESGYNVPGATTSTGYTKPKEYTPFQYTTPNVNYLNMAEPYYAGIEQRGVEGVKGGMRSGMQSALGMMGRRGVADSGLTDMQLLNQMDLGSRKMADISTDIGMQRARDYTALGQSQQELNAQMEMERQARQGAAGQFGAQFGEGQRQYDMGYGLDERQAALRNVLAQYEMDRGQRGERLGAQQQRYAQYQQPYQNLLQLYGLNMQAPGNQPQAGWGPGVLGGIGSLGGLLR